MKAYDESADLKGAKPECNTKIDVNEENQLKITLFLIVNENVVIKELASNLQNKIKVIQW